MSKLNDKVELFMIGVKNQVIRTVSKGVSILREDEEGAADLVSIVIGLVVIALVAIGVMQLLGNAITAKATEGAGIIEGVTFK